MVAALYILLHSGRRALYDGPLFRSRFETFEGAAVLWSALSFQDMRCVCFANMVEGSDEGLYELHESGTMRRCPIDRESSGEEYGRNYSGC